MKMFAVLMSQRGEARLEGEMATKGAREAVMENKNVEPSPGTPELRIYKRN